MSPLNPLLALIALSCLFGGVNASVAKEPVVLIEKDNPHHVTLEERDKLTVKLAYRPGTAYRWSVSKSDPKILESLGEEVEEGPATDPKVGGTETQVFTFRAIASGKTQLELKYTPALEPEKVKTQYPLDIEVR